MPDIVKTMKPHIKPDAAERTLLEELADRYAQACCFVSEYVFNFFDREVSRLYRQ